VPRTAALALLTALLLPAAAPVPGTPATGVTATAGAVPVTAPVAVDPAGPDAGAARTTWSLEPAATGAAPEGRVSVRHAVDPGAEVADALTLTNFSDHPATFEVYAGDGVVTADGQFDLPPTGTEPEAAGAWIALGDAAGTIAAPGTVQRVEVPAGARTALPFVVRVPADATPGDHPAGIVAALATDPGTGVAMDSRVGTRLHLRVTGELAPALAVQDVRTTYTPSWNPFAPGTLRLDYTVANTGNVRLGASAAASASGPFGVTGTSAAGPALREVLPGQSAAGSVEVDAWPLVRLAGAVAVTPSVVGEDEVAATLAGTERGWSAWAVPWVQVGLLVLAVGSALAIRQARSRREAATRRRIAAAVAEAQGSAA
jgi:hypothetical protein